MSQDTGLVQTQILVVVQYLGIIQVMFTIAIPSNPRCERVLIDNAWAAPTTTTNISTFRISRILQMFLHRSTGTSLGHVQSNPTMSVLTSRSVSESSQQHHHGPFPYHIARSWNLILFQSIAQSMQSATISLVSL